MAELSAVVKKKNAQVTLKGKWGKGAIAGKELLSVHWIEKKKNKEKVAKATRQKNKCGNNYDHENG